MIFRYFITTLCVVALASISIAMTQDLAQEPEPGESRTDRLALIAPSRLEGSFELILTDELIQKLRNQGRLVFNVPEDISETVTSIKIRLKDSPETSESLRLRTSSHLSPKDSTYVIGFYNKALSNLKRGPFQHPIPSSLHGRVEKVELVLLSVPRYEDRQVDPLAQPQAGPFAQRQDEPFLQRQDNSLAQRQDDPFNTTRRARDPNPQLARETTKFNSILAQLTQQLKATESESEKVDLQDEIRDLLESEYDRHLGKQDAKLVEMEKRLEKLREQYKKQKDAKDKLVEMRMTSIVSDAEGLGWPNDRRNTQVHQQPSPFAQTNQSKRANLEYQRQRLLGQTRQLERRNQPGQNFADPNPIPQFSLRNNFQSDRQLYVPDSNNKSHRLQTVTTAQTKFWLQEMAKLAKAGNWKALKKMGHIVLTYKDDKGQLAAVNLEKENDLLAQALESAAEQKLYYRGFNRGFNRLRWNIKLDEEKYKLHVITGQKDYSTTSAVVMSKFINADLMQEKIKSKLADNDADNDSVEIQFDNEERLIILSGDSGAVKEAEEVVKEMMDHSKTR